MCDLVQGAASSASWSTSPASTSFSARIVAAGRRFFALVAGLASADAAGPFAAAFFVGACLATGFSLPGVFCVNLVAMFLPFRATGAGGIRQFNLTRFAVLLNRDRT